MVTLHHFTIQLAVMGLVPAYISIVIAQEIIIKLVTIVAMMATLNCFMTFLLLVSGFPSLIRYHYKGFG